MLVVVPWTVKLPAITQLLDIFTSPTRVDSPVIFTVDAKVAAPVDARVDSQKTAPLRVEACSTVSELEAVRAPVTLRVL